MADMIVAALFAAAAVAGGVYGSLNAQRAATAAAQQARSGVSVLAAMFKEIGDASQSLVRSRTLVVRRMGFGGGRGWRGAQFT